MVNSKGVKDNVATARLKTQIVSALWHAMLLVVALTVAIAATGCALMTPGHTDRASDQWSNGRLVGMASLNSPVALQVDDAGNSLLVWIGTERELSFARLDERAQVIVQQPLDLPTESPMKPKLAMDSTGQLHLTWIDAEERNLQLYYARLSADGEIVQQATLISSPEQRVSHSAMILDPVGQTVELFWSDNVSIRPGCYHAALDWSGAVVVPVEVMIPNGLLPAAQIDRQGFVHLAWRVETEGETPKFHYAVYDPQRRALGSDIVAGEPLVQASALGGPVANAKFAGPWMGLDERSVYLAWTLEVRGRAGLMSFTFYQAFPQPVLGQRGTAEALIYPLPDVAGEAVHVRASAPALTGNPRFLDGQPKDQVLACYTEVYGPGNMEALQIAVLDLQADRIQEQEIVTASSAASLQPSVAIDSSNNLHLAWIDTAGFNRYQVVYASTSPQVKETLNRITTYEVLDQILSTVVSVFSALFFVPIVLGWMLLSVGWLFLFGWITGESEVSSPRSWIALGLAMVLQLGMKLFGFSSMLTRVTFGSILSPSLGPLVGRWILPLLLAAFSAGLAWIYLRRARSRSIFIAYLIYAVVDSLLTLVIYVTIPLG